MCGIRSNHSRALMAFVLSGGDRDASTVVPIIELPPPPTSVSRFTPTRHQSATTRNRGGQSPPSARVRGLSASAQSSSVWYGAGKTSRKKDVGGRYEVRRRDLGWPTSRGWTRARWDDMTAYMVCFRTHFPTYILITPLGMYATAIPHCTRGRRSFRRNLPTLGNRRRGGTAPRPMCLPPTTLTNPGTCQNAKDTPSSRFRPNHT